MLPFDSPCPRGVPTSQKIYHCRTCCFNFIITIGTKDDDVESIIIISLLIAYRLDIEKKHYLALHPLFVRSHRPKHNTINIRLINNNDNDTFQPLVSILRHYLAPCPFITLTQNQQLNQQITQQSTSLLIITSSQYHYHHRCRHHPYRHYHHRSNPFDS